MPLATFLTSQTLAFLAMIGTPNFGPDRRIRFPWILGRATSRRGRRRAAQASGGCPPAVNLTLPTRGWAAPRQDIWANAWNRVGCLPAGRGRDGGGEESLGDRRASGDGGRGSVDTQPSGFKAAAILRDDGSFPSYRANDPGRPTICLVHGINSSSGGFVP
jgi:hypothetical protein